MDRRTRGVGGHRRIALVQGWQVCCAPPAAEQDTSPPDSATWFEAPALGPVAAVLRATGQWSLDVPAVHLDAHDWWYRLRFDLPQDMAGDDLVLGFDGLATLARAWLNGQPLFDSDNMFVAHQCKVGPRLQPRGNELLLRFASLDQALAARKPRPRWRAPMVVNQQLRWWRTTLIGRTPGWSPPCAPVGPWRGIWLEQRSGRSVELQQLHCGATGGTGLLSLRCTVEAPGGIGAVRLVLSRAGQETTASLVHAGAAQWQGRMQLPGVALWWPHTHGEPALYEARLQVTPLQGEPFEADLGRVGFRSLALQREDGDFEFIVNGVPVFCRGACWTPLDPVGFASTAVQMRHAVDQCRSAGMNMLRVAGPMVYEHDDFLDACDELGLLVWHDFMFASMDYPGDDPGFAASVEAEVRQQASRWQGRPSLALLCGNSEASQQAAMWGAARDQWLPRLFAEQVPAWVQQVLPDTPYWPSSAWGGVFPHQVDSGSVSYYGVGAYLRPEEDARRSGLRFASECLGFSNVPEPDTIARMPGGATLRVTHAGWKARASRDLGAGWDFEDVRDHYLGQLFRLDPVRLRYADHERYLMLSRVASGETMARAFAEWRRAGSGCRGALVWWLRDFWAGAGWGLLDDASRPKACWHILARALQPCTVLLTDEGNSGLVAHLVNEGAQPLQAVLDIATWRGDVAAHQARRAFALPARSTQAVPLLGLLEHFADLNHAYRFGPLNHDAVVASLRSEDGSLLAQAFHFPAGMDLPREADLGLQAQAQAIEGGRVQLQLLTRRLALGVHVQANGFEADDQYFHLVPGDVRMVTLHPTEGRARPWRCTVHALNAAVPAMVRAPNGY